MAWYKSARVMVKSISGPGGAPPGSSRRHRSGNRLCASLARGACSLDKGCKQLALAYTGGARLAWHVRACNPDARTQGDQGLGIRASSVVAGHLARGARQAGTALSPWCIQPQIGETREVRVQGFRFRIQSKFNRHQHARGARQAGIVLQDADLCDVRVDGCPRAPGPRPPRALPTTTPRDASCRVTGSLAARKYAAAPPSALCANWPLELARSCTLTSSKSCFPGFQALHTTCSGTLQRCARTGDLDPANLGTPTALSLTLTRLVPAPCSKGHIIALPTGHILCEVRLRAWFCCGTGHTALSEGSTLHVPAAGCASPGSGNILSWLARHWRNMRTCMSLGHGFAHPQREALGGQQAHGQLAAQVGGEGRGDDHGEEHEGQTDQAHSPGAACDAMHQPLSP